METIPLVDKLNILKDEAESMKKKVAFMISVSKENRLKEEHITKIYEEWVSIAKRLNKGRQMIEQYENVIPNKWDRDTNKKFQSLCNLYDFLLAVLGFYGSFLKHTLDESHYRHLLAGVLEVLRD